MKNNVLLIMLITLMVISFTQSTYAQTDRGFVGHDGNQFIWTGSGEAFVPNLWMHYGYITEGSICSSDAEKDRAISEAMDEHGFNGIHLGMMGQWFNCGAERVGSDTTVDMEAIRHLRTIINKVYAKGGMVHIWAWGDSSRSQTSRELPGGIMGPEEQRVWDVVYDELNDVPGWTVGYGYDLNEWVSDGQLNQWVNYLESKPNWNHLTSARNSESTPGASGWLNQRTSANHIASLQAHQPTYAHAVEALNRFTNKPVMFEDRFRIGLSGTFAWTPESTRQGLWRFTMAGGVASIWGNMSDSPEISPYPNRDELRTFRSFWDGRFLRGMERDNSLTDGYALRRGQDHYIFYKEDTDRLSYSFSGGDKQVIAVDTKDGYQEYNLGVRSAGEHTFTGDRSDWAIAVGDFDTSAIGNNYTGGSSGSGGSSESGTDSYSDGGSGEYSTSDGSTGGSSDSDGDIFSNAPSYAPSPPVPTSCHAIKNNAQTPSGFASPVSLFTNDQMIKGECLGETVNVEVGNNSPLTYVYNMSHKWTGSTWEEVPLEGENAQGDWIPRQATGEYTTSNDPSWYVAYGCEWISGAWKCGCTSQSCQTNQWQIQAMIAPKTPTGSPSEAGVSGEREITGPNVSGSAECLSGSPTISESGIYEGCGNSLGSIKITGTDILVRDVNAGGISFEGAERAMVTGANLTGGGVFVADSRDITFEESTVQDVSGRGMDIRPQNTVGLLIRNNLFTNIRRPNCGGAGTADSGAGIAIGHYYKDSTPDIRPNIIIEGNRFEEFPCDCGDPISAIHIKSNDTIVRNNVVDACMAGIGVRHGRDNQILNNVTTGQSYGIWLMGDNHRVSGNNANQIQVFGGNITMEEFDIGDHPGGSIYPVARNVQLSDNSVSPRENCWGSCPYQPTYTIQ